MTSAIDRVLQIVETPPIGIKLISHLTAGKKPGIAVGILCNEFGTKWSDIAEGHKFVIAWEPKTADEWLREAVDALCAHPRVPDLHKGTIIGALEACNWLDQNSFYTAFQSNVLTQLARLICKGKVLNLRAVRPADDFSEQFNKRLRSALERCLNKELEWQSILSNTDGAPRLKKEPTVEDLLHERSASIKKMLDFLVRNLPPQSEVPPWSKNFLDRLTYALVGKLSLHQKLQALSSQY